LQRTEGVSSECCAAKFTRSSTNAREVRVTTASFRKKASAEKELPLDFWQSRQWQLNCILPLACIDNELNRTNSRLADS